ncbi:Rossmann-like and DUF2520 domain-containing protein [Lachnobacterium bovis]|uniref:Predicted oxidoreductase, contains short-chain dehydrogenase (SDR) and DUF2520 domains n=1 Tax=Lachnobacterium bovis TaxID=140626 RepID=A0A1H9RU49_9FIRM|nr:Rossmann-like and DUF2520 domain-containing protein [Lachnobacterium bovis]SER75459.1 Predicted oxidoreductase, contains short-chain dehydrogenase (SDR) and DUF2520 domains [Lachnobacterium bovis]
MKVGFIGAGKVGCSLGMLLNLHYSNVIGYYSKSSQSSQEAAQFTKTKQFFNLRDLVKECDTLFLTVPDDEISKVWECLKELPIRGKMICHCSGSLSSKIFSNIENTGAYGYSIHPLLAVSDRYASYKELPNAIFTIEGNKENIDEIKSLFKKIGIKVETIDAEVKMKYHAAAVMSSNLVVALIESAQKELMDCGFTFESACKALTPLIRGNVEKIIKVGTKEALTGPIERNDVGTVEKHLAAIEGINKKIYDILSLKTLEIAKDKHSDVNYSEMEAILKGI